MILRKRVVVTDLPSRWLQVSLFSTDNRYDLKNLLLDIAATPGESILEMYYTYTWYRYDIWARR